MSDDIVTRLRMSADLINGFPKALAKSVFPTGWLSEAADEIERLRADRNRWRELANDFADAGTHDTAHSLVMDDYLAWQEARRG